MLSFRESDSGAIILAAHYAHIINNESFLSFITGKSDVVSRDDAVEVIKCFWEMVKLSIDDAENGICISGAEDAEFWMHKLFNKVSGYMVKNGYEGLWDELKPR